MNQTYISLSLTASAVLAAYSFLEPKAASVPPPEPTLSAGHIAPDPAHLKAYTDCSAQAELRVLSHAEAVACSDHYLRLKLSFLPDVGMETFAQLEPEARWAVNQRGYAAYLAWKGTAKPSG